MSYIAPIRKKMGRLRLASSSSKPKKMGSELESYIKSIEELFMMSEGDCVTVMERFTNEMMKGLAKKSNSEAKVRMLPTYITNLPNGSERGKCLILDLGGTFFRVGLVELSEGREDLDQEPHQIYMDTDSQIFELPHNVITGEGEKLFDHIAACMAGFVKRHELSNEHLNIGFTFSFPCEQQSVNSARLLNWTKGFSASGVVGKDVAQMLRDAISKHEDIQGDVVAVVNDSVGTLGSCIVYQNTQVVGLIVGTGTNASYVERVKNIELVDGEEGEMCINTEWGTFGDDGVLDDIIRNQYDREVDESSNNPGTHRFEKMMSSSHMCEIVRFAMIDLAKRGSLFNSKIPEALLRPGVITWRFLQDVEQLADDPISMQSILSSYDILQANLPDSQAVQRLCKAVMSRAGALCGAALSSLALRSASNERSIDGGLDEGDLCSVVVAVDGTVYKFLPTFRYHLKRVANELCSKQKVELIFVPPFEGSAKGTALITCAAMRSNNCA